MQRKLWSSIWVAMCQCRSFAHRSWLSGVLLDCHQFDECDSKALQRSINRWIMPHKVRQTEWMANWMSMETNNVGERFHLCVVNGKVLNQKRILSQDAYLLKIDWRWRLEMISFLSVFSWPCEPFFNCAIPEDSSFRQRPPPSLFRLSKSIRAVSTNQRRELERIKFASFFPPRGSSSIPRLLDQLNLPAIV